MPRLSDSMEEGTVLKWLVEEGGEVKRGEPLVEIETDKANMTYEADTDGVLIEVVAKEGDTLPIGEVIARIGEAGEASGGRRGRRRGARARSRSEPSRGAARRSRRPSRRGRGARARRPPPRRRERPSGSNGAGDGERIKASPVARRMARELGVELARLEGSGPGGRIVKADVEAAAEGRRRPGRAGRGEGAAEEKARAAEPARGEAGAKGEVEVHELTPAAADGVAADGGVEGHRARLRAHARRGHDRRVELRARLKEVADPAPSFNDMVVKAARHWRCASTRA